MRSGMTAYDLATAVARTDDKVFTAESHPGWWVVRGRHGGYISAILLRALTERLAGPSRHIRSFTTHFTAAPTEAPLTVTTSVDREGSSMSFLSARMEQDGIVVA